MSERKPIIYKKREQIEREDEESRSRLYSAYCRALSVALELAHLLGVKSCEKCGRKVG